MLACVCVCVRALVERVLQDTTEDLRAQCSRVDRALSQRCEELTEAKSLLETKLAQVTRQAHTRRKARHKTFIEGRCRCSNRLSCQHKFSSENYMNRKISCAYKNTPHISRLWAP